MSFVDHDPDSGTVYRQCLLRRGGQETTTWLPERFAEPGRVLRLRGPSGWTCGWRVVSCHDRRRGGFHLPAAVRGHRRRTGDS